MVERTKYLNMRRKQRPSSSLDTNGLIMNRQTDSRISLFFEYFGEKFWWRPGGSADHPSGGIPPVTAAGPFFFLCCFVLLSAFFGSVWQLSTSRLQWTRATSSSLSIAKETTHALTFPHTCTNFKFLGDSIQWDYKSKVT